MNKFNIINNNSELVQQTWANIKATKIKYQQRQKNNLISSPIIEPVK